MPAAKNWFQILNLHPKKHIFQKYPFFNVYKEKEFQYFPFWNAFVSAALLWADIFIRILYIK